VSFPKGSSQPSSTVPNSPVGFPKLPKSSTRSPGVSSWSVAEDSESGGLLARPESGVAPGRDCCGCGALRSLGIGLLIIRSYSIVSFQESRAAPFAATADLLDRYSIDIGKHGSADPHCTVLTINLAKRRSSGCCWVDANSTAGGPERSAPPSVKRFRSCSFGQNLAARGRSPS
jgi:hypothetical protein